MEGGGSIIRLDIVVILQSFEIWPSDIVSKHQSLALFRALDIWVACCFTFYDSGDMTGMHAT